MTKQEKMNSYTAAAGRRGRGRSTVSLSASVKKKTLKNEINN
jgi:hypothetical protein